MSAFVAAAIAVDHQHEWARSVRGYRKVWVVAVVDAEGLSTRREVFKTREAAEALAAGMGEALGLEVFVDRGVLFTGPPRRRPATV